MKIYLVMKNGAYAKDFSDGKKTTRDFSLAEKFVDRKSALVAAQTYSKNHGKGFHVVEL